jgi:hypothetical protein
MKKVRLYTCTHGLKLYSKGSEFGAWNKDSLSFEEDVDNILFEVDSLYVIDGNNYGEYDIVKGATITIIEGEC